PERPHGQMHARWRHVRFLRDESRQLVQGCHLSTRQDVGSPCGSGGRAAQAKALHQIVDVREVIKDTAISENDEPAAADTAKELEKSAVARTVNARRPDDDDFDPGVARRLAGDLLPFQLCLLIDVARPQRRIFVGWWMLDVPVYTDSAAGHHAPGASGACRVDDRSNSGRVDGPILCFP